jgi:transglutaminase-like putative cysteine protease
MARPSSSITPTLALAGLSAATALALTRVFVSGGWLLAALAAAIAPALLVWFARRRGWSTRRTVASIVGGGALLVVWVMAPNTTWNGVPTASTVREILSALGDSPETLRSAKVPVDASSVALFLAITALWVTGAVAAWLALRLDATVGAIVPSLVLFVVVSAIGKGPWLWTAVIYAAAACLFVLAQEEHLLEASRSWFHVRGSHRHTVVRGGIAALLCAVAAGAILAPQLPGAGAEPWFDYRDFGDGDSSKLTIVSPLVDIRASLLDQENTEVFRVRAERGVYWRMIALEDFDGRIWGLSDDSAPANEVLRRQSVPVTTRDLVQVYRLTSLGGKLLPAAYAPINVEAASARVLPESSTLVRDEIEPNFTYRVLSQYPDPTIQELRAATVPDGDGLDELTELPEDFPDRVRDLVAEVTADAPTPYDKLVAWQNYLRDPANFEYRLDVAPGHSSSDIERFLFETRAGYCEQFAGTFAAGARTLGLPTRVAVGFTPGTPDPATGDRVVTAREMHAWPEVYLGGAGWTMFEPTPGRFDPSPNDATGTGDDAPSNPGQTTDTTTPTTTPVPTTTADGDPIRDPRDALAQVSAQAPDSSDDGPTPMLRRAADVLFLDHPARSLGILVLAAIVLSLVGAAGVVTIKAWRKRKRRTATDTRARVEGAWDETTDRLVEAGISPDDALTPTEFALRRAAAQGAGSAGGALVQLAHLVTEAMYSPDVPSDDAAGQAWEHADEIDRSLRRSSPLGTRVRRRVDWRVLRDGDRGRDRELERV